MPGRTASSAEKAPSKGRTGQLGQCVSLRKIVRFGVGALAIAVMSGAGIAKAESDAWEKRPYKMVGGKVDFGTYNGFRRYHSMCHTCHGPDALGSSFGPSLVESMKTLSYLQFVEVVALGRTTNLGGTTFVMPSFAENKDVVEYIDDIYAYLKARSDGALKRGRPPRLPKPKKGK